MIPQLNIRTDGGDEPAVVVLVAEMKKAFADGGHSVRPNDRATVEMRFGDVVRWFSIAELQDVIDDFADASRRMEDEIGELEDWKGRYTASSQDDDAPSSVVTQHQGVSPLVSGQADDVFNDNDAPSSEVTQHQGVSPLVSGQADDVFNDNDAPSSEVTQHQGVSPLVSGQADVDLKDDDYEREFWCIALRGYGLEGDPLVVLDCEAGLIFGAKDNLAALYFCSEVSALFEAERLRPMLDVDGMKLVVEKL
jgi:hypothetical protein